MTAQRLRVAAYGVCTQGDQILLARFVTRDGARYWTLPGGGIEHGEDPYQAVLREVGEETGFEVAVERLLGVDARTRLVGSGASVTELHSVGVFYQVRVTGGELRHEVGGTTDLAAWVPLADLPGLERAVMVDIGLDLSRRQPADGRGRPLPPEGLLRH